MRIGKIFIATSAAMVAVAGIASAGIQLRYQNLAQVSFSVAQASRDTYTEFLGEIYTRVKTTYWEKITDEQLSELFRKAAEKANEGSSYTLASKDRVGVLALVPEILKDKDESGKKETTAKIAAIVLANLKPFGRSQLLTEKVTKQLVETVSNIDTSKDLYKDLGIAKGASPEEIKKAFESQPKTEKTEYAHKVLTDTQTKTQYDSNGAEPTILVTNPKPGIAYMRLTNIAPQTLQEFPAALKKLGDFKATALIIDLRGNIGGVIDALQYALGPWLGPDQYAYEFFHQGEKIPYKTKTTWAPELKQYKQTVVLIDNTVQSSAEVMTATLKKYHIAVIIGTPTKGWGTIEELKPMTHQIDENEKYSTLLVQDLTLRDDQQPIEGKGVDPDINITAPTWKQELHSYFNNSMLTSTVEQIWNNSPK